MLRSPLLRLLLLMLAGALAPLALGASAPSIALSDASRMLRAESEGKSVELECPVSGDPPPLIQWSINAVPLHELGRSERRLLLDGGRVLRIRALHHDLDSGLYQCNASNFHGHAATAIFLKVESFAPRFRSSAQRVWKAIRHSVIDFNCEVEAAPEPAILWVDAADMPISIVPDKLQIFENATLRISDVSNADEGYYYCNVSNKYGINRAMNKLEVYTPTYFSEVPSPARMTVDAGQNVEFRCHALADSRLTVTYLWTQNGKNLNATLNELGVSVLRLENFHGDSSGRVDCAAVTDVDVKVASAMLVVRDIPALPLLLKVECSYGATQRVLIVWRKPRENGALITHYTVDVSNSFRPDEWKRVYTEKNLDRDLYKLILPLSPWMNYTFRVTAHNAFGASEAATSAHDVCVTHEDVPHTNPRDVRVYGTEPGNLVIQWRVMEKPDWNAPGLRYLIRYRPQQQQQQQSENANNSATRTKFALNAQNQLVKITMDASAPSFRAALSTDWREFFVEDPLMNDTVIRDLPIFTPFDVQLRAVNAKGYSAVVPKIFSGFSGEDVPELAPKNLRLIGFANFSTAIVAWDSVPVDSVRGHFKGYKVSFWLNERPYFVDHAFVDKWSLRANVSALEAVRNYSARVFVLNGRYESASSNQLQFATPEGEPSKVHDLRVVAVGAHSIYAIWQPPLKPNGHLRGYFLAFENVTSGTVEETYVLYRQQYYLHELLMPDSPYRVSVWAETNGGEGARVRRAVRTWSARNPDEPRFVIRSSSPFSANVEWLPSAGDNFTRWQFSGTYFRVKYRRISEKNWLQSEWVVLPFTTIELVNLTENTDYEFVGVAREGARFLTESRTPTAFRTDDVRRITSLVNARRLRNAAWFLAILIALALALLVIALMCCVAQRRYGFGGGIYEISLRDKKFRRYESISRGGVSGDSMRSASTGTVATDVAFLDDASDEHRRFVASSVAEILSAQSSAKKKRASLIKRKEAELQAKLQAKCDALSSFFAPPPSLNLQSDPTLLSPKFRSGAPPSQPSSIANYNRACVRLPPKPTIKLPHNIDETPLTYAPENAEEAPEKEGRIETTADKNTATIDERAEEKIIKNDADAASLQDNAKLNGVTPKKILEDLETKNMPTSASASPSRSTVSNATDTLKLASEYDNAATLRVFDEISQKNT